MLKAPALRWGFFRITPLRAAIPFNSMEIIIILSWLVYSLLEGIREAWRYHAGVSVTNEHPVYAVQRFILLLSLTYILGIWEMGLAMALMFPFYHDGVYYWTRDVLTPGTYPKRWGDQSLTTSAILSVNIHGRVIMALAGTVIYTLFAIYA